MSLVESFKNYIICGEILENLGMDFWRIERVPAMTLRRRIDAMHNLPLSLYTFSDALHCLLSMTRSFQRLNSPDENLFIHDA